MRAERLGDPLEVLEGHELSSVQGIVLASVLRNQKQGLSCPVWWRMWLCSGPRSDRPYAHVRH
jgi:hypothetical protein